MNDYRVKFYTCLWSPADPKVVDTRTMWVEANNEHHAVAEATMLAMAGTGNMDAMQVGEWLRQGAITSVYSVIETN